MTSVNPGGRLPKNYRIVLEVVREQAMGQHATTSDIFSEAKRRQPRIGYSTVYRALDRLRHLGLVSEVRIPGTASALYEPLGSTHAHFVCDRCGRVDDIDDSPPPSAFSGLAEERHIEITNVSLTLHGICAQCRQAGPFQADPP